MLCTCLDRQLGIKMALIPENHAMKKLLLMLGALLSLISLNAQYACKTGPGIAEICYFRTGQKSTERAVSDKRRNWKVFTAYNRSGKVIYQQEYGQFAGSSYVEAKYYADGGISSAHYTMQPDGGIQFTNITTFFTPDGRVDHVEDMSIGNDGEMHLTPIHKSVEAPRKEQVAACNPPMLVCSLYAINGTGHRLSIHAQYKKGSSQAYDRQVNAGDSVLIGNYYPAGREESPLEHYSLNVIRNYKGQYYNIAVVPGAIGDRRYVMITHQLAPQKN
jgi:hypothetical protein